MKRLLDPETHIERFVASATRLGPRLGPILVQLPPHWKVNIDRITAFLDRTTATHRWAFEFRDSSWFDDRIYALLKGYNAAMCLHDMLSNHPRELTADWVYLRYHGPGGNHADGYRYQRLVAHARWISMRLNEGRDVYVYFNNDANGYAVRDASNLKRYLNDQVGA